MAADKPLLMEVMERSGYTRASLKRELRFSESDIKMAFDSRINAEKAGEMCRVLAETAGLDRKERKQLFSVIVNMPGREDPMTTRVSTEDSHENLWDR